MFSAEIKDIFDNDITATEAAIIEGANQSPDIITPARKAELLGRLGLLYLPNFDAGTVELDMPMRSDEPLAYLPSELFRQVRQINATFETAAPIPPAELPDDPLTVVQTVTLSFPRTHYTWATYPFAIISTRDILADASDRPTNLAHELVHYAQCYRPATRAATPPPLLITPREFTPKASDNAQKEDEAYRIERGLLSPDRQIAIQTRADKFDEWMSDGSRKLPPFEPHAIMRALDQRGELHADRRPSWGVLTLLSDYGIAQPSIYET